MANPLKVLTALSASSGAAISGSDGLKVLQGDVKVTGGGEISGSHALKAGGALSVGNGATIQAGNLAVSAGEISGSGALKAGAALTVAGAATISGGNLDVSAGEISGSSALKAGGALTVGGAATLGGDLAVNGGDITSTATTFNLLNSTVSTLSIGGAATTLNLGVSGGNTKVKGNLVVEGSTVTVDSTNVQVQDPIMLLGSSSGGAAADGDRGFVFSLAAGTGPSKAFFWDDSAGQFAFANTDSTAGGASVNINGGYANVQLAQLTASVVSASGVSAFGVLAIDSVDINGGTIDGASIGASVQSTAKFTTLSASSTLQVGGVATLAGGANVLGNVSASNTLSIGGVASFGSFMSVTGSSTFVGAMAAGTISASALNVSGVSLLDGNVTLGNASSDIITVTGQMSASAVSASGDLTLAGELFVNSTDTSIFKGQVDFSGGFALPEGKAFKINNSNYIAWQTSSLTRYDGTTLPVTGTRFVGADFSSAFGPNYADYGGITYGSSSNFDSVIAVKADYIKISTDAIQGEPYGQGIDIINALDPNHASGGKHINIINQNADGGIIRLAVQNAGDGRIHLSGTALATAISASTGLAVTASGNTYSIAGNNNALFDNYLNVQGAIKNLDTVLNSVSGAVNSIGGSSVSPAEYYSVRVVATHSLGDTAQDLVFFLNGGNSSSTNLLSGSAISGLSSSVSAADLLGKMAYASFDVAVQAAGGNTWTNDLVSVTVDAAQSGSNWYPKFVISAPSLAPNSKIRLIVVNETSGTIQ